MEDEKTPTFRKFPNPNFDVHSEGDYWEKIKPVKVTVVPCLKGDPSLLSNSVIFR